MAANNTEHSPFLRWSSALIFLLVAWGIVVSPGPPGEPPADGRTRGALADGPEDVDPRPPLAGPAHVGRQRRGRGCDRMEEGGGRSRSFRTSRRASERLCQ